MSKDIEISSQDLLNFYRQVKEADPLIGKELRKTLVKLSKTIVGEVQHAALDLPSSGEEHSDGKMGLRAGIAAATETKINQSNRSGFSIRIRVSGTKFQAKTGKYKKLPRYVEGLSKKHWRHPVFASKGSINGTWDGSWVDQKSTPFLLRTVLPHKKELREDVYAAFLAALKKSHALD